MLIDTANSERFGELFPQVENILHCGLYNFNAQTGLMSWSNGVYSILGIDESTPSTQENFYKFINPECIDLVTSAFKKTIADRVAYQIEFSITNAKGLHKRLYAENYLSIDAAGHMTEYNGVLKDITESYYYKRALEQKIQQLDKSNRNLQEFVYVASHDLQEPLRKISTFTERLNTKFDTILGQEGNMFLKRILSATASMQTLLEDLLSFSRLSFDEKKFEKISVGKCVESVIADLEVKIEETKTVIRCDHFPEIEAYPSQIKQLFNNLIGNAIKFRKPGEAGVINIANHAVEQQDFLDLPLTKGVNYVKITVTDNGIGFDQEFSEKIFMIFQRLNGKAEYAGSGVGLAICKKIVDNHHGFIFANSATDQGARFTILLPKIQS
jgi:signal transduction histidine kinase